MAITHPALRSLLLVLLTLLVAAPLAAADKKEAKNPLDGQTFQVLLTPPGEGAKPQKGVTRPRRAPRLCG